MWYRKWVPLRLTVSIVGSSGYLCGDTRIAVVLQAPGCGLKSHGTVRPIQAIAFFVILHVHSCLVAQGCWASRSLAEGIGYRCLAWRLAMDSGKRIRNDAVCAFVFNAPFILGIAGDGIWRYLVEEGANEIMERLACLAVVRHSTRRALHAAGDILHATGCELPANLLVSLAPQYSAVQLKGWQAYEQKHRQGLRREAT